MNVLPLKLHFRVEALSLPNHPNFSNPESGATDPDFGLITSTDPETRFTVESHFRLSLNFLF
jgi:hypothetical protein